MIIKYEGRFVGKQSVIFRSAFFYRPVGRQRTVGKGKQGFAVFFVRYGRIRFTFKNKGECLETAYESNVVDIIRRGGNFGRNGISLVVIISSVVYGYRVIQTLNVNARSGCNYKFVHAVGNAVDFAYASVKKYFVVDFDHGHELGAVRAFRVESYRGAVFKRSRVDDKVGIVDRGNHIQLSESEVFCGHGFVGGEF